MGASIKWVPTERVMHDLDVGAPNRFMELMEAVFGSRQPTLNQGDIAKLEALRDAKLGLGNSFDELIEAIRQNDEIEIIAQY